MEAKKKASLIVEDAAPCPTCGKLPETIKGRSYWMTRCATQHIFPVTGHPMKTKREAIQEWNNAYKAT
ncbi:hypothetical protein WJ96_05450 [Burkholderia ubonensis]|uniref:Restriction alleviation protein, Lar family n=1 Tax=Burkholderia ubonensis TaxID=101571 RepID=A0AAW3MXU0_9BURK|nr:hypothetical protein [Burkholderia ubonensis]KVP75202.1 hypothetical protein WJ93_07240 [Burkholderia ubonensis]KVP96672.1 hypothetical protein WJ97_12375 [Burkholderia ubonensis]KVP98016.1 hypothetical protein WJ96_05450 [Burkholderia ubonensis]KVZ92713.1 hypothetical protein WL25_17110 [Burkholderia ubonensis]